MSDSPRAGGPAEPSDLANIPRLLTAYYTLRPDPAVPAQRVAFGTSGHRGSALDLHLQRGAHPRDHPGHLPSRREQAIDGPLFLGIDTHALSEPAFAHGARGAGGQRRDGQDRQGRLHADARGVAGHPDAQRGRTTRLADGIVVTPSHNPPEDGGFKYNPPTRRAGGRSTSPASIEDAKRTALLAAGLSRGQADSVRARVAGADHRAPRLPERIRGALAPGRRSRRDPGRADSRWASIRSAVRASTTGAHRGAVSLPSRW